MLQLVPDQPRELPRQLPAVDTHVEHPVRPGGGHGHEAGAQPVPAIALLHIHDPIARIDRFNETAERG
jgi:hypothetical protein